ncbi:MAG: cytochrome c oxidase accessory protein CcoG [Oxalobacteraceae bacterium]|nr:cytochrome c oxidase accessory protein CcoG [Oxalobacteraceae bacterium]
MESASPEVAVVKMYAAREEIYPREVQGRYASLRWFFIWATQLLFYGLPWLNWNDRQAVLFDLGARKFYIFGVVLWPQDFIYLAALLIISAYALFLFTAIFGRVWCGFTCPQTVYTEIFMWIERKIEGSRSARMRLDRQPASVAKFLRKFAKHLSWGAVALWTGFTFVGYFTPIHVLAAEVMSLGLGPWEWFWVLFYSCATYGNAGWMREQVCKYMCPYARFQSAMFDKDSLIITYDQARGEPRGARNKSDPDSAKALGDCIDCSLCVQVCPTGIDIRKGLQYECIGCAACVDACNSVMDKIGAPRGLVRYWTDHAMTFRWSTDQILRHAFRPRIIIYSLVLLAIISVVIGSLLTRTPLKMDVIRDRGSMGREIENGLIENVYRLQIMNTEEAAHRYRISVSGIDGIVLQGASDITLGPTESRGMPVNLRIPAGAGEQGSNKIFVTITDTDNPDVQVSEKAVFFVPR